MQILSKIWNNFKTEPDIWFFYGFLITFTLSVRKVITFFPMLDNFNEYSGAYLYLSDIFLILTLIVWGISILYNKNIQLSIDKLRKWYAVVPFLLVFWAFLSIFWAKNQEIALFRSVKLLEFYFLYLYIIFRFAKCSTLAQCSENVPPQYKCSTWNILRGMRGTFSEFTGWNVFFKIIISVGVIQAIMAIFQFLLQHSIGIFWLKESLISPEILGVAKVVLNGEKFIRAYGLFPHPNILGGFLFFSIVMTLFYYKMFHVEHLFGKRKKCFNFVLFIQGLVLFLTFSKSALIGLLIALGFLLYKNVLSYYKCSTPEVNKLFHVEQFATTGQAWNILWEKCGIIFLNIKKYLKIWIFIIFGLFLILLIIKPDFYSLFIKSLDERILFLNISRGTILNNFMLGVGNGQFVLGMQEYSKKLLEFWQFQPVHNICLLIWSELGLIGFILFMFWILKTIFNKNVSRGTFLCESYFKAVLFGFLFIMFFDHYLWDIQQGQILFWMIMGLVVGASNAIDKK